MKLKVALLQDGDRIVCSTFVTVSSSGITQPPPFPQKCVHMILFTVKGNHQLFSAVPGLDTSPCLKAQPMSVRSTKNFANLTNFCPNWSMAHLKKVKSPLPTTHSISPFSFHFGCKSRDYDNLVSNASSPTGEFQTVKSSRERLWELLSADWLREGSGPLSWQQSYHRFLQKEGVDVEMQKRASVLQLWVTQVSMAGNTNGKYFSEYSVNLPLPLGMLKFLA